MAHRRDGYKSAYRLDTGRLALIMLRSVVSEMRIAIGYIEPVRFRNTPWWSKLRSVRSDEKSVKL